MKTGQVIRAFDFSDVGVRTMTEQFTFTVLEFAFGCMNLGTDEDAARLSKKQRRIRYYMMSSPVVRDMQKILVTLAKSQMHEALSSDVQQRLAPPNMPGSSTDVAPPPQPPYPAQPDELPPLLGPLVPHDHRSTQTNQAQMMIAA